MPTQEARQVKVPCTDLFKVERDLDSLTEELENLVDRVPSRYRKELRSLSEDAGSIRDEVESIDGLHWKPKPIEFID